MPNPYDVLGVARDADQDTIRKAYRKLARRYHPDVNKSPGAEQKFKEINAAYDVVGDPDKRKLYDEFGDVAAKPGFDPAQARAWQRAGARGFPGGFPGGGFPGGGFGFEAEGADVEDLLGDLFGAGTRGGPRPRRGRDQHATLEIDPMLAITGGDTMLRIQRPDGAVESLKVRIPAGARDGGRLRLKGQGLPPPGGGPCGDLHLRLRVPEHPILRRDGDDLEMDVPITIGEAIRGGAITVPTPTGEIKVNVPPGAANGRRLRIKGRGVQRPEAPGDLYLVLRPTVPDVQDAEVVAAAERIDRAYTADVRAGLKL